MSVNIQIPIVKKTLHYYDITFTSGIMMPITINVELGDEIFLGADDAIRVRLTPKPSMTDPKTILAAEDITIYKAHVISVQHRVVEVDEPSPEEKLLWPSYIQEMSKTIQ